MQGATSRWWAGYAKTCDTDMAEYASIREVHVHCLWNWISSDFASPMEFSSYVVLQVTSMIKLLLCLRTQQSCKN